MDISEATSEPILEGTDIPRAAGHNSSRLTTTARGGRRLSRMQLPWFDLHPPRGFGVLTTTGRVSGQPRPTCVRALRHGSTVYLVAIGGEHAGWIKNVRANPAVEIRIRGGRFRGNARNLRDEEHSQAEALYTSFTGPFEYLESLAHLSGRPRRRRIQNMHRHWFPSGVPVAIDIVAE